MSRSPAITAARTAPRSPIFHNRFRNTADIPISDHKAPVARSTGVRCGHALDRGIILTRLSVGFTRLHSTLHVGLPMFKPTRILHPTDFSEHSTYALGIAADLARQSQ